MQYNNYSKREIKRNPSVKVPVKLVYAVFLIHVKFIDKNCASVACIVRHDKRQSFNRTPKTYVSDSVCVIVYNDILDMLSAHIHLY